MKKLLALLLSVALLCTFVPFSAMVSADSDNLIADGSFEADGNWKLNGKATIKDGVGKDGTKGLELYGDSSWINYCMWTVTVEPNTDYVLTFDYKGAICGLYVKKGGSSIINPWPSSSDWTNMRYTFNSGDATTITVSFNGTEVTDVKYVDNIRLIKASSEATGDVVNGDFEDGESNWKLTTWGGTAAINANAAKEGALGLELNGGWSNAYQNINMKANTDYQISFWVKGYAIIYLKANGADHFVKWPDNYTDWTRVAYDFNSGDNTTLGLEISCGDNSAMVDSVQIIEKVEVEPDAPLSPDAYDYLQLAGVQNWTQADLNRSSANNGHESNVTATYYLSDQHLVGAATQSIKAVKSSASASFNCLVNKAYDSNGTNAPSPWAPVDGVSKISDYDGVMIAVRDKDGNVPDVSKVQLRILSNPARNGWGNYQVSTKYVISEDGYMMFPFANFPSEKDARACVNTALGISFLLYSNELTEYYFSDFKAYRLKRGTDFSALEEAVDALSAYNGDGAYAETIAAAQAVLNNSEATQDEVDAAEKELRQLLRPLQLPEVNFDEDNIVLSFGAVSDIHITGSATSTDTKKYEKALQILKEQAGGTLDAITIAGDFSSDSYNGNIGTAFKTVTDTQLGADANVFFVSGNHDAENGGWSSLSSMFSDLSKYTANDLPSSQHDRGNRHMVINGYHYIGINMMDYWKDGVAPFAQQDLDWLEQELAAARADAPGQPIFVYLHAGVYGTTYGSELYSGFFWSSSNIQSYLAQYPEVVTFSGHVHFPLMDERTIWQGDFTALNCGSVQYMAIESGYLQSGTQTTIGQSSSISSGLLVQVDKNNNLKITRLNFTDNEVIKEPYYISAPDLENKTNLLHYNDDYFNLNNTAPTFSQGAMVTGVLSGSNIKLTFDAATDDDMVHHYLAEIKDTASGKTQSTKIFSEFYFYSNTEEMPKNYTFNVPHSIASGDKDFTVALYAVDSMGLKSEPITFDSAAPAKNGWVNENGKWAFYVENVRMTKQWLPEGDNWYYVDETGYRVTEAGLFFDGSDWYYLNEEGAQQYNVWYEYADIAHYFGADGTMVTNSWIDYEGERYYVDEEGYLVRNKWIQDGDVMRYVGNKGYMMRNGLLGDHGTFYYFDENGDMVCSDWRDDPRENGRRYYFGEDGVAYKSMWAKIDGKWYYFADDSYMVTDKWVKDSVGWCYLGDDGVAVTNCWKKDSVGWCYLNENGSMTKSAWVNDGTGWYYLDEHGYMAANCWKKDSKGWCYLTGNGKMATNQWIKDSVGWCYVGDDGYCVTNTWKKDSKGWCYLDEQGRMAVNRWVRDSKGWCYVGDNGYAVTNCWKKDSVGWCYLDGEGSMTKSAWVKDGGSWYYLDAYGYMVAGKTLTIDGTKYTFDGSGKWVK